MKVLFKYLKDISSRYKKGENIIQYITSTFKDVPRIDAILVSYDLQAGSYTKAYDDSKERKVKFCEEFVERVEKFGPFESVLNVGVGEATILGNFVSRLKVEPKEIYGFDISWSRVKYGIEFMTRFNMQNVTLTTGDLFKTPFMDNSIELVFSNHSLEPNGGREEEALKELYRVSSKYVVINEPCYEWASDEGKQRIEKHGYVKNLHKVAERLGYEIVSHEKFDNPVAPLNPTSCLIIKKEHSDNIATPTKLACPITSTPLINKSDSYFSNESLLSYPVIKGIPCLLEENAVLTTHLNITI